MEVKREFAASEHQAFERNVEALKTAASTEITAPLRQPSFKKAEIAYFPKCVKVREDLYISEYQISISAEISEIR